VSQVAGRAGRGELAGRIVVQTTVPDHPAIVRAAAHDFEGFATAEDALRGELGYPPHARIVRVLIDDTELDEVEGAALRCAEVLRAIEGAVVLGPAPAPIAMMRGRHRHHVLVKAPTAEVLDAVRTVLVEHLGGARRPRAVIDVDPTSVL
jgi:primosomal protein N' (replication factor Y)